MKRLFTLFVLFLSLVSSAQDTLTVTGMVNQGSSFGLPVHNQPVYIDVQFAGNIVSAVTYTNELGAYLLALPVENSPVLATISIIDCDSNLLSYEHPIADYLFVTQNFVYCEGSPQGCNAAYSYEVIEPLTVVFTNQSEGENLSYSWDFGDGNYSFDENPEHGFLTGGQYPVCLTVMNIDSSCFDVYCETVVVTSDTITSCQADYYYYPIPDSGNPSGNLNTYQFVDISTGNIGSWAWDFGDGYVSTDQNPIHTFGAAGVYEVCLTVQLGDICESTTCQNIVVQNDTTPCIAQFVHYPDFSQNDLNLTIQFQDMSYGNITGWFWDFGDGFESTEQNPLHTFPDYGVYHVCLTITGPDCESTWCEDVNVMGTGGECFNYFTYETVDQTVAFSGVHVGGAQATYIWEFGDGTTAEGQEVTHVYDETGMYYVSLVTSDENMCTAVSSNMIVIGDTIQYNQVYGQVFAGDFPIDEGEVMIFSLDSTGSYNPFVEITPIVGDGVFVFPYVPSGSFVLYVFETGNEGYLPTYYGDVINWEEASIIVLGEPSNPYDIHLVEAPGVSTGLGGITGLVSNSTLRSTGFLDKINMLLYDSNKQPLGFTHVDESGQFGLYDLAFGVYYLYPELSGVASDFMRVELSEEQMQVDLKMTFENGSILGVSDYGESVSAGNVYPNPVGNKLFVPIENSKSQSIEVTIIGMDGRTHYNSRSSYVSGSHVIEIEVDHLPQGLYVILVSNGAEISSSRKFIK
ncbi:MAG: PKD domain-containing protein [Bacteroidales bacterium]|nr:PKD domain-containing protein [Bacteroidales bacterium]